MIRKLGYCRHCKKRRQIEVELTCITSYDPMRDVAEVHGFGDVVIRCKACYGGMYGLTSQEIKELEDKAVLEVQLL